MAQQKTPSMTIKILAVVAMLVFTIWVSWAEGPLLAAAPLIGAIWLALQIKRDSKTKTISIAVLGLTAAVAIIVVVYFAWVSSFTF